MLFCWRDGYQLEAAASNPAHVPRDDLVCVIKFIISNLLTTPRRFMSGGMKGPIGCTAVCKALRVSSSCRICRAIVEWQELRRDDDCSQNAVGTGAPAREQLHTHAYVYNARTRVLLAVCATPRSRIFFLFHFAFDRGCPLVGMLRTLLQKQCRSGNASTSAAITLLPPSSPCLFAPLSPAIFMLFGLTTPLQH